MSVMSLIPASTIFGKMIGQEPLVLFFGLLALYAILKYLSSFNKQFLVLSYISIILGILSDWPMAFFIFCFTPLFVKHKKIKVGIYLTALSVLFTVLLIYVYWMRSGFWDLQNAAALRSFTGLLSLPAWPILWVVAIIFRFLTYFNPIFLILSFISLVEIYRRYIKNRLSDRDVVVLGFLLFGVFHLFIYAQATFTHPYLIYYWLPFITFASSLVLLRLFDKKAFLPLIIIACFSIGYLFLIQKYKAIQIEQNIWRYELTRTVSKYLTPYEEVIINS